MKLELCNEFAMFCFFVISRLGGCSVGTGVHRGETLR